MGSILKVRHSTSGEWINIPAINSAVDLTGYATEEYVNSKVSKVEEDINAVGSWVGDIEGEFGGAIPYIHNAEVGQVLSVANTNNDGMPTEWETINLPTGGDTGYRLIYKIVIDETNRTGTILITEDMDGNPLELTQLFIYADWKAHESNRADAYLSLNGGESAGGANLSWIFCVETTPYKYTAQIEVFDGFCYFNFDAKITEGKGTSRATYVKDISGSTINRIRWSTGTSTMIPVGSTFAVYGY